MKPGSVYYACGCYHSSCRCGPCRARYPAHAAVVLLHEMCTTHATGRAMRQLLQYPLGIPPQRQAPSSQASPQGQTRWPQGFRQQ